MRHILIFLALLSTAACKQGLGDRCQVSSDCDDGLVCVLPVGGTPQSGGMCEMGDGPDMMSTDLAPDQATVDLSTNDAGEDLSSID